MYRTELVNVAKPRQNWLLVTAESPEDIFDKIESTKVWAFGGNADCSSHGEGDGWAETRDLSHALDVGRRGWAKGRDTMMKVLDDSNVIRRSLPHKADALDVGGSYPVVPLAVAGDPMCMVTHGMESTRTKPVVRIVVNVAVSGAVTAATIMQRGGAILSWVDGLEAAGIRVEIEVIESGLFQEGEATPKGVVFSVKAKRADEPLDIDRVSFLICHPAIQRRLFFALYEREADQGKLGLTPSEAVTYGAPTDALPAGVLGLHSVYFPAMLRNNPDYATPATAVAAVERMILSSMQLEDIEADRALMES